MRATTGFVRFNDFLKFIQTLLQKLTSIVEVVRFHDGRIARDLFDAFFETSSLFSTRNFEEVKRRIIDLPFACWLFLQSYSMMSSSIYVVERSFTICTSSSSFENHHRCHHYFTTTFLLARGHRTRARKPVRESESRVMKRKRGRRSKNKAARASIFTWIILF